MSEKPILFTDAMVAAILRGDKTQTRRVVKAPSLTHINAIYRQRNLDVAMGQSNSTGEMAEERVKPLVHVGDVLWVREAWRLGGWADEHYDENKNLPREKPEDWGHYKTLIYEWQQHLHYREDEPEAADAKWRPSIFMPRWASRITLKVSGVVIERLQDITEEDALREGVSPELYSLNDASSARDEFRMLWDSINGKKHPWDSNPWVWVYEFSKTKQQGAQQGDQATHA